METTFGRHPSVVLCFWPFEKKWRILEQLHWAQTQYIIIYSIYIYFLTGRSETNRKEMVKGKGMPGGCSGRRVNENWVHPLWLFSKNIKKWKRIKWKKKKMLFNDMPGTSVFIIAVHFRRPYQTMHIILLWLSFPSLKIHNIVSILHR